MGRQIEEEEKHFVLLYAQSLGSEQEPQGDVYKPFLQAILGLCLQLSEDTAEADRFSRIWRRRLARLHPRLCLQCCQGTFNSETYTQLL